MTVRATSSFGFLRYEPGNPEFPVLPDGIVIPHVMAWGGAGGLAARRLAKGRVLGSAPAEDSQRFAGWQTDTTWIQPAVIDFGVITSPVQRRVSLYNTRFASVDVTTVDFGTTGISLIGPALTQTLNPYDGLDFTIEASVSGVPNFDELVTFTTALGDITFRVIGRRVFSLNVIPEAPLQEILQFKTDLIRSTSGTEKAYSLLQSPNSHLQYKVRFTDDLERIRFRNQFIGGASELVVGVQKWWEARQVTSAALAADLVLNVPTASASFVADKPVSIVTPGGTAISATVDSFDSTSITFSTQIGTDIPLGSFVMPVGLGWVSDFPTYDTYPVNAEDATYGITLNQETDFSALPGAFPTLNDTPILEFPNEIRRTIKTKLTRAEEEINSKLSNRVGFSRYPYSDEIQPFTTTLKSQAQVWLWRQFMHYIKGSYKEIYVPTFTTDFPDVTTTASNVFNMSDTDYAVLFGTTSPADRRGALRFQYDDGTILYRTITAVVDNGDTEQFTVSSAVTAGTPKISYMHRSRILGDTATLVHYRTNLAVLTFRYRTIIA